MKERQDKCEKQDIKDDDSLIEQQWFEKYKGDSRKWLIRDGSYKNVPERLCSTMKAAYTYPISEERSEIGSRKAILLKQFEEEAVAEVLQEQNAPKSVEEYCTEYDEKYNIQGFQPDDRSYTKHPDLYEKYPLYSSMPTSYYSYYLKNRPRVILHGLTETNNPTNPFKRCAEFSKPLSEVLDNRLT
ncbi:uncharacterized protein [Leptinotarsa decemlineata]|uniref:uncharacterized protein n=1 Tax=Leptinotarsa decemlineata TaxID=7539 RepID=UPI003D30B1ED